MKPTLHALITLFAALSLITLPVHSDDAGTQVQIDRLQQQVSALEERLQALEKRFDRGVPLNKAMKVEAKPGGWRNPENWAQLARDMTKDEVIRFLGEPESRKTVKKFEYWGYGDGKASIYMNRLKAWEPPSPAAR